MTTFKQLVQQMSRATGLSVGVINAQVMTESGYNANAVSPAGAEGWLQFLPGTYNQYASAAGVPQGTEFNPSDEAAVYDVFMKTLLNEFGGNVQKALAAYNAGPGNIAAGMGYANGILAQAGESTSYAANAAIAAAAARPSVVPAKTVAAAKAAVTHIPAARVTNPKSTTAPASGVNRLSAPGRPGTAANTASAAAAAQAAHAAHVAHVLHEQHVQTHPAVKTAVAKKATVAKTAQRGNTGSTRIVNR